MFATLKSLTKNAVNEMEATDDLTARKAVLSRWERMMGGQVRQEYRDLQEGIRTSSNHSQEEKEALRNKLGPLTKQMVLDRSLLEGLSRGEGPAPHQAGGAFPPPNTVEPGVAREVETLMQSALEQMALESGRPVPGELMPDFITRCDRPMKEALILIESVLKDTGAEYRELLHRLHQVASGALAEAIAKRGQASSDDVYRRVSNELSQDYSNKLRRFRDEIEGTIERTVETHLTWARQRLRQAQAELEAASIDRDLSPELTRFERELNSLVGDLKGWWHEPPTFERVTTEQLDRRAHRGQPDGQNGVYLSFYSDGHLKSAVVIQEGRPCGALSVDNGQPHARYEDSANVAEFHPDGTIEEYGGRYERESKARITFRDWVIQRVEEMC